MKNKEKIKYDKFISDGNTFISPVCNKCKHNRGDGTCEAFTRGIPDEIMIKGNKHDIPLLSQNNNIIFEEK